MIVHQIWLGGTLPQADAADVAVIRNACSRAGWQYRLWSGADLWQLYGSEPAVRELDRLRPHLPAARFASLASDYFRWRVLVEAGGLYLDTDTRLTVADLPPLPTEGDLWLHDRKHGEGMNTAFILAVGRGQQAAARICAAVSAKLRGVTVEHAARKWGLLTAAGPRWVENTLFPELEAAGYKIGMVPRELASSSSPASAFWHRGEGSWIHAGGAAMPAQESHATFLARQPRHLRPLGGISIPAPAAAEPQPARPRVYGDGVAEWWRLPPGVKRVVVFSNVTDGFPDPALRAGDLCIHIGHARHAAAAMQVPGTQHWLMVRHGGGWHWYTPASFDGFSRVRFVDDAFCTTPFAWYADYPQGKSPTTGFLTACCIRELYPGVPLILAGFDPGVAHGTPLWSGHAWAHERTWYATHGFTLLTPETRK